MAFPDHERFTCEDIATRWGKSLNYVCECVRTGMLKLSGGFQRRMRRIRTPDSMDKQFPVFTKVNYVKKEDLYAFEERFAVQPSALGLSKKDLTGKTNSVRSSDRNIQIVNEMHEYFFVQRKLERVTMPMIIAEIQNRHSEVSKTLAKHIASIVKSHDLPGRPPES